MNDTCSNKGTDRKESVPTDRCLFSASDASVLVTDIEEFFVVPNLLRSLIFGMSNNTWEQNNCNSNQEETASVDNRILDLGNSV